jgi:Domain of unknown function (DUF4232)
VPNPGLARGVLAGMKAIWTTGRPAGILAVCVLAVAAVASCATPAAPGGLVARRPAGITLCHASDLRAMAGREGENQGAHGDILITNTGSAACLLHGVPAVRIVNSVGAALATRPLRPARGAGHPLVLPAGGQGAELATTHWSNWCGSRPGPLDLRLRLPGSGVLAVPFDGPPDYAYVPACVRRGKPSTVQVVSAYRRAPGSTG